MVIGSVFDPLSIDVDAEFVRIVADAPNPTWPPLVDPDSSAFAHKAVRGMEEALMAASSNAYSHLRRAVEHAVLTGTNEVDVVQPEFQHVGRYKFHWSVFVHGIKRNGRRDREPWGRRKLLVPFEQLRRDLAKSGYYLVLRYESAGVHARVFSKSEIEASDEFSLDFKHEHADTLPRRPVWLHGPDDGELKCPYQMVPF